MSERSPYRFRGPETWAAAREAYIAGETAASIAERLGVTTGALRQRAARGGWTRRALAAAAEAPLARVAAPRPDGAAPVDAPPAVDLAAGPAPGASEVLDAALSRAAACLQAGRAEEALRAIELGERLAALAQTAGRLRPKTLDEARAVNAELTAAIEEVAHAAAIAVLTDPETAPEPLRPWARAWRAEQAAVRTLCDPRLGVAKDALPAILDSDA